MTGTTLQQNYSVVARWLHWIIAICVIAGLTLGLLNDALEDVFPSAMVIHMSLGLTVLALTIVRIFWRLGHRPPPMPDEMPGWEKMLAHVTHIAFYALLLILPLSGWLMSSPGKFPISWFGIAEIPKFPVTKEDPIAGLAHEGHEVLGFVMLGLAVIHILTALRHHFVLKDNVLRRMLT
jgi:cytochrome b561